MFIFSGILGSSLSLLDFCFLPEGWTSFSHTKVKNARFFVVLTFGRRQARVSAVVVFLGSLETCSRFPLSPNSIPSSWPSFDFPKSVFLVASDNLGVERKGRSPWMEAVRFRLFSDGKAGSALLGVLHGLQHTGTRADRGIVPIQRT